MADEMMTNEELADKIEWEGGVDGAMEHGIRADRIADPEIAKMWSEAKEILNHFWSKARLIAEALELDVDQ